MGFDDRLWIHLVEEHDAHLAREPSPIRRRHPAARRSLAAGVVVAGIAAVSGVVAFDQPSGQSAWARQVMQRAAAVLPAPSSPHTILHVAGTVTLSPLAQRASATTVSRLSEDAWIQQGSPWGDRTVLQVPGGPVLEDAGDGRIYNRTTNTVYPPPSTPSGTPHYTLVPIGTSDGDRLRVSGPHGRVFTQTIDASIVQSLHDGTADVEWSVGWNGHVQKLQPLVVPSTSQLRVTQAQQPDPGSTGFAAELRGLLDSGHARVTRATTADGQRAIEISSVDPQSGPHTNYYVSPETYAPIELESFGYDNPKDVTRVRFTAYQTLPLAGHRQLLHVHVPATARVDHTPADYWHAEGLPRRF